MKFKKKSKNPKPATPAQKRARERNWNKAQIMNIKAMAVKIHNSKTTKNNERVSLVAIIDCANKIINNWNSK